MKRGLVVLCLLFYSCYILGQTIVPPANGDGSLTNPYVINNLSNMNWLSTNDTNWDKHFILENNIIVTQEEEIEEWDNNQGWKPIGTEDLPFTGTFDGQNHYIENLYINRPDNEGIGLFGWLSGNECLIKNIGLTNVNISGYKAVGALVGVNDNYSSIENCYSRGIVSGIDNNVGGLAGKNNEFASITSSYSACHVFNEGDNVGGLVGLNDESATIINCYALGYASGAERVGGLIGRNRNNSIVENCFSIGQVSASTEEYINGLVGRNQAVVNNSFWDIETSNCTEESAGEGITTLEMKNLSTYMEAGWDIENIWGFASDYNEGYPYLLWQDDASLPQPPVGDHLNTVNFSVPGGFYLSNFDLILSHEDSTTTIVYTLDGSEPDINNLTGTSYFYKNSYPQLGTNFGEFLTSNFTSTIYNSPIEIFDRSIEADKLSQISTTFHNVNFYAPDTPVKKGIVVKAKAFKNGCQPSDTITHSYYVLNSDSNPYSLPLISISLSEDNLFDYYDGIYVAGIDFDSWREDNPTATANGGVPANYHRSGSETEKIAYMEYFDVSSTYPVLSQNIGIRIHGGWSRSNIIKSLRLYARSEYGQSTFDYNFFPDLADNSFKRLILRNAGNDCTRFYLRDPIMHKIVEDFSIDTQAYQPVIVYINGEYWGIHNMRERFDNKYLARVYGVDEDNLDLLEKNALADEGDNSNYQDLISFLENHETIDQAEYNYLETRIDIDNFTDYQIAEIFSGNADWPANNMKYWRLRTDTFNPDAPLGHDGRWRWLFYDVDLGLGLSGTDDPVSDNTLLRVTTTEYYQQWSTLILRRLLTNPDYETKFINKFCDYLNTTFKYERTSEILNNYQNGISDEISEHIHRYSRPQSYEDWQAHSQVISDFLQYRPTYLYQHLKDRFELDSLRTITLDVNSQDQGFLVINSINLDPLLADHNDLIFPWTGYYFPSLPITVEAVARSGYTFSHWSEHADTTGFLTISLDSNSVLTANFQLDTANEVNEISPISLSNAFPNPFNPSTTIKFYVKAGKQANFAIYNLRGQKVRAFGNFQAGQHEITWDGKNAHNENVASGIYLYQLKTDKETLIKKCILMK